MEDYIYTTEGVGHQLQKYVRHLSAEKSNLEQELFVKLIDGHVVVGSPEYRRYCERIDDLAYEIICESDRYNENE